jgi:hypothetical protein
MLHAPLLNPRIPACRSPRLTLQRPQDSHNVRARPYSAPKHEKPRQRRAASPCSDFASENGLRLVLVVLLPSKPHE